MPINPQVDPVGAAREALTAAENAIAQFIRTGGFGRSEFAERELRVALREARSRLDREEEREAERDFERRFPGVDVPVGGVAMTTQVSKRVMAQRVVASIEAERLAVARSRLAFLPSGEQIETARTVTSERAAEVQRGKVELLASLGFG